MMITGLVRVFGVISYVLQIPYAIHGRRLHYDTATGLTGRRNGRIGVPPCPESLAGGHY